MKRPVWLFSLDTEQFAAVPLTTGRLKAYFQAHGARAAETDIEIVHFFGQAEVLQWCSAAWAPSKRRWFRRSASTALDRATAALRAGLQPVVAFSVYTWNAEVFLQAIRELRRRCPGVLVVAGGPHVQRPQDFLYEDGIDVVVMGEGEQTFQELLDHPNPQDWRGVKGLAFLAPDGQLVQTESRPRAVDLDAFPSALEVIPLVDQEGNAIYSRAAYETSRGCPFRCAFCEWGTGAIGTKMYQHSLPRIQRDLERLVAGGVKDIWLCDSNFGALKEDLDKARIIARLHDETGRPATFGTSWSKTHNRRVQEIVLLLKEKGLLQQYVIALQTLTPLALELSNRKNMRSNHYEPILKEMVDHGVPVSAELIWGLPGDNLPDFERNLDQLSSQFPNINIYGFTLLPGTEFFEKRDLYRIETIPIAGYGKAKGEYVVGCHTFSRREGVEGYLLICAHVLLVRGHVIPLTARYLCLLGSIPVSAFLRRTVRALAQAFGDRLAVQHPDDSMQLYENRVDLYLAMLGEPERLFQTVAKALREHLAELGADHAVIERALAVLMVDSACSPRVRQQQLQEAYDFDAFAVWDALTHMRRPSSDAFAPTSQQLRVDHPGGVGTMLKDPDGGGWFQGTPSVATRAAPLGRRALLVRNVEQNVASDA